MSWPVNWIEQAGYFADLKAQLASLQAQAKTVTVHSFSEPTQQMWEDAYVRTTGEVPPIQPGTRLFWFDLKNGIPKRYSTVNMADRQTIDPLVRPFLSKTQARSALRFIGTRQMFDVGQINPVYSPIRHKGFSLMYDLGLLVKKNLICLIVHFRMASPVWISVLGDRKGSTAPEDSWGGAVNLNWWTLKREAALAAVAATNTVGTDGFVPQTVNSNTFVPTEEYSGYTLIFGPAAPFVSDEHQPFNANISFMTLAGANTAQANPLHLWQGFGIRHDAAGLKELYFGVSTPYGAIGDHAYVYGLFASDPGPLEVFNV